MKQRVFKFHIELPTAEKIASLHMFAAICTFCFCRLSSSEKVKILAVHKSHTLVTRCLLKTICILSNWIDYIQILTSESRLIITSWTRRVNECLY